MKPVSKSEWKCLVCGVEKKATSHQMRQKYCSTECVSSAYRERMRGNGNPNRKSHTDKTCLLCGSDFKSYNDGKFCTAACYSASRPRASANCENCGADFSKKESGQRFCCLKCSSESTRASRVPRIKIPRPYSLSSCPVCGSQIRNSPSQNQKHCSYECHLKSGGAFRAGMASAKSRMRYGPKKDANHEEIFSAIQELVPARDLSAGGCGIPDGIAWINEGWHLFDVKNPKTSYGKRGLNKNQKNWADSWQGGPVYLIYTKEEAVRFASGDFGSLKRFPEIGINTTT